MLWDTIWHKLFQMDWVSSTLLILICMVGGAIMKSMLPTPGLAFLAFPVTVVGAFAANAAARDFGITLGGDKMLDVAVASSAGMTLGAIATIIVFRLLVALGTR